jgi:ABC-2 type transport system ATP-binding protein
MDQHAIEIRGLSKQFHSIRAVNNISLSIESGEMFALVGPDGAGKTTTLKMLCGIITATAGTVTILGYDLKKNLDKIKKNIGYLSQRFSLYGDLSIDENIEFFAEIHGVTDYRDRREELLEFTRLKPFRRRLAERLSGGMKQKLSLACTLIHRPRIIFMDEPTTGVDPVSRREFWIILSNLLRSNITIVMTTPYLDEAERCTRVGLMNKGSLLAVDSPVRIKEMMKGNMLRIITPEVRKAFMIIKDRLHLSDIQMFGDRLDVAIQEECDPESIRKTLESNEVKVESIRIIRPSLENVFISLIKSS